MPSFADMKQKAIKAKDIGVTKIQQTKDRNTSIPLAKTNWDPYSKQPAKPPPPPPAPKVSSKPAFPPPPPAYRGASSSSNASSPSPAPAFPTPQTRSPVPTPPMSRTPSSGPPPTPGPRPSTGAPPPPPRASPGLPPPPGPRHVAAAAGFSPPLGPPPPPAGRPSAGFSPSVGPPPIASRVSAGPPPIIHSTRPDIPLQGPSVAEKGEPEIDWTNLSPEDKEVFFNWLDEFFAGFLHITIPPRNGNAKQFTGPASRSPLIPPSHGSPKPPTWSRPSTGILSDFILSHPPSTTYTCAAHDLAHYFFPSTPWPQPWYASDSPFPPPLVGNNDISFTCAWRSSGTSKSTHVGVLFTDLSMFWGTVKFSTTNLADTRLVERDAVYLSRPKALGKEELVAAHETYGETIASFAESFVGTGQYCARGECWDLASEALKYFEQYDYVPKPVPSVSRTHGHLIYEGRVERKGAELKGRWRGGDDRVRRGDIVEWRKVRIGNGRGYSTLGDPDHTAIVVQDLVPNIGVRDGGEVSPVQLGTLVVVEQSVGQPPERREYNLSGLEEGEMWIYRPVAMVTYLGVENLRPMAPDDAALLRI